MKARDIYILAALFLVGCNSAPQFEVRGAITGADGETLYLEHTGLVSTEVEDSCVLNAEGN